MQAAEVYGKPGCTSTLKELTFRDRLWRFFRHHRNLLPFFDRLKDDPWFGLALGNGHDEKPTDRQK